jgi:HAE1 family hydrophobic/amphiphilic exporter-1
MQAQLPPGVHGWSRSLTARGRSAWPLKTYAHADRRRTAHGADRFPVPELVALHGDHRADAADFLIGTFLFMYAFGFSINMVTLMALSLCVGLLIDDAIVVRENIVRHVQMGKPPLPGFARRHAGNRPGCAGHHLLHRGGVPAHRLHGRHHRQVLPRVRRDHRGGGADLDVRELHAGPDALVASGTTPIEGHGKPMRPTWYDKTIGRVTGWFDRATDSLSNSYQGILRWSLGHKLATVPACGGDLRHQRLHGAAAGHRVRAQGRLLGNQRSTSTRRWARRWNHRGQGTAGRNHRPRVPRGALHAGHHQHRQRPGQDLRQRLCAFGGPQGPHAQRRRDGRACCASASSRCPGITVTHVGLLDAVGGNKQVEFSLQGPDLRELERLTRASTRRRSADIPGLVDLDSSVKPTSR